jgi:hypothetical protein
MSLRFSRADYLAQLLAAALVMAASILAPGTALACSGFCGPATQTFHSKFPVNRVPPPPYMGRHGSYVTLR